MQATVPHASRFILDVAVAAVRACRAGEGIPDGDPPPPMPAGVYPGWKTRVIQGEAKTDKVRGPRLG